MADADFGAPPTFRTVAPKPKMTVYYALLIIALFAMLTACLFMYLEIKRFGGFGSVPKGKMGALDRPAVMLVADATLECGCDRIL